MPSLNHASILVADDRAAGRYRLLLEAQAGGAETGETSVTLHDLSQSGLLFETEASIENDAEIMLDIPGIGPVVARTMWTNGSFYGAQFAKLLSPGSLKGALSQSKVVWPEFSPLPPLDIDQARSPAAPQASKVAEPAPARAAAEAGYDMRLAPAHHAELVYEDTRLPLPVRLRIIAGLTIALWSAMLVPIWLAYG